MPPPPRRPDDPNLSGMILDAEVLDAEVLDAEVLDAVVLDAEVLDADVLDAGVVDADVIEAEVVDAEPLALDELPAEEPSAVFDLGALDGPAAGTAPAAAFPVYQPVPKEQTPTGADLLSLDADPPRPATRTATRPATAARPAVRITFVAPGEASPFAPRG